MEAHPDWPQLGSLEVDPARLGGEGAELKALLAELGVAADPVVPSAAPAEGWRLLRSMPDEGSLLGAPADEHGRSWWIAQAHPARGGEDREVRVHERVLPLRPSRAERSRGLALRWPEVTRSAPDVDLLAIDVVNVGDAPWRPQGDSFHPIAFLHRVDDADGEAGGFYAFVGGRDPALPLDPGEYARVKVTIDPDQWRGVRPGPHHVRAVLPDLAVRTEEPLLIDLTEELIERHRPQIPARPPQRRDARELEKFDEGPAQPRQ